MALAGPPEEQIFVQKEYYSRKSATSIDMSRAGPVMLGARIVLEQSSLVNETHWLTPKYLVYSCRLVKKNNWIHSGTSWGRGKFLVPFWGREAKRVRNRCPIV